MNTKVSTLQLCAVVAVISGIIGGVLTAVTLGILGCGWLVNWMFPTIPYEFASIIAGQGLLIAGLVLAVAGRVAAMTIARQEFPEQDSDDDDIDDSSEAAEWLAERIADITHAKLTQTAPKNRRYTAKPRGK